MKYAPQMGDLYGMMALFGAAFFLLIWLAFRLNNSKHPDPRRRVLMPMLAYFLSLLALMGFLGTFWTYFKYPVVELTPRELVLNGEAYPRPAVGNVRMESYTTSGLGPSGRVLLVQTKDRKTWAFPDSRYPIDEIMRELRKPRNESPE
ncbi:hypothetical protein [Lewinella sp. W8]|uniref:hypothetical protein n=1 Tax=Lewinella sp. W8 TaxID=2528208 RepID=UPI001067DEF4|nr:hypothetical protein [Lewinella sp. W8]MTB50866.1 hypothetical protein [Lewinella sp. W8]